MMSIIARLFKWTAILLVVLFFGGIVAGSVVYYQISKTLPSIASLKNYKPPVITSLYAADGRKIAEFYEQRRIVLPLSEIPDTVINAFVAAEDARFFQHTGIDLIGVFRAMIKNLEAGSIVQGGSTITQQVAKSFFLSSERTYTRKFREAILSYRIEKALTKKEILYLYLNQIYLGHGAYGVAAAAENYFGKKVNELNLAECALIAGLPQAPSSYSPYHYPARAKRRQIYVLNQMVTEGYVSRHSADAARAMELDIKPVKNWYQAMAPWYAEHVRRYVEDKYGRDMLYNGGLSVYTAVNLDMQRIAREQVEGGLRDLDKRQGYRGPVKQLAEEEIEPFLTSLRRAVQAAETPPGPGDIVKGVVVDVDDDEGIVYVRFGAGSGQIPLEDMTWARVPDPEVAWYKREAKIDRPSQALRFGDVIDVRIKSLMEDETGEARAEEAGEVDAEESEKAPVNALDGTAMEGDAESDAAAYYENRRYVLSLEQTPAVEAALVSMAVQTGHITAMIGGRDAGKSQFNRVIQSRRQPGSAFKPVIYAAALDKGYTPASIIIDSAIIFEDREHDFTWKPQNYEERFFGPTLFRKALEKSHNIPTIKILMDIGVDYVRDYAKKLGVDSPLSRDLSIALGSSGLAPIELAKVYAVFPNLGRSVSPIFITKILDREGRVLEENTPAFKRVIGKDTAYIMTHLLKGVVEHGTGRRVRSLNRPAAGKTGTTDNLDDAWFAGYTPDYVTVVWVGYDQERSLGKAETGASAASPIWLGYMQEILKNKPVKTFEVPEGVVFSKIDAKTGLLPSDESVETFFECFKAGTVPTEYADPPDAVVKEEQFFKKGM
ncbi:MAG: PBP1A family penicillin-binding protein [Thermodesulfobacteriota bacterium]|nr:PBP1A family penicillin-binding protein [Thermodesulfobacteriota bacterium]